MTEPQTRGVLNDRADNLKNATPQYKVCVITY